MSRIRLREALLSAIIGLVALGIWEASVRAFDVPAYIVPTPTAVIMALLRGILSGLYLTHLAYTLGETLLGFDKKTELTVDDDSINGAWSFWCLGRGSCFGSTSPIITGCDRYCQSC